jgi:hypothetical protein
MLVPLLLGFIASYAAANVAATLLHSVDPLVFTLVVGTVLFVLVVLATRWRRTR